MRVPYTILPKSFYDREPALVAPDLLGKLLVRKIESTYRIGRIVETEAYLPFGDAASHSFKGKTKRNASMFKGGGHAYVYRMRQYSLFNVVTEGADIPGGVLIRAAEPIIGFSSHQGAIANGPGKLCNAFLITHALDGVLLTNRRSGIWIAEDPNPPLITVITSTRIGITHATEARLRFYIESNPHVSHTKRTRR